MICPKCKNEISYVNLYSECRQECGLKGSKIVEYGTVQDILDTHSIECPECSADISDFVEAE